MNPYNRIAESRWEVEEVNQRWRESEMKSSAWPHYRILHIEDCTFDSKWFTAVMAKAALSILDNCEFLHTNSLAKGLKLLKKMPIDAVVTDLVLPDSANVDAVKNLFEAYPGLPTLVLTSSDEPATAVDCIRSGARDYFVKQRTRGDDLARAIRFAIATQNNQIS